MDNSINLGELSKQNSKTEFENFKTIMEILMVKAEIYDIPQKVLLTFKGNEAESDIEL